MSYGFTRNRSNAAISWSLSSRANRACALPKRRWQEIHGRPAGSLSSASIRLLSASVMHMSSFNADAGRSELPSATICASTPRSIIPGGMRPAWRKAQQPRWLRMKETSSAELALSTGTTNGVGSSMYGASLPRREFFRMRQSAIRNRRGSPMRCKSRGATADDCRTVSAVSRGCKYISAYGAAAALFAALGTRPSSSTRRSVRYTGHTSAAVGAR